MYKNEKEGMPLFEYFKYMKELSECYEDDSLEKTLLDEIILITDKKIDMNIKHYNNDVEKALDDYMLDKWKGFVYDYFTFVKPLTFDTKKDLTRSNSVMNLLLKF